MEFVQGQLQSKPTETHSPFTGLNHKHRVEYNGAMDPIDVYVNGQAHRHTQSHTADLSDEARAVPGASVIVRANCQR